MGSSSSEAEAFYLPFGRDKDMSDKPILKVVDTDLGVSSDEFEWKSTVFQSALATRKPPENAPVLEPEPAKPEELPEVQPPSDMVTFRLDPNVAGDRIAKPVKPRRNKQQRPRAQITPPSKWRRNAKFCLAVILSAMIFPSPDQVKSWQTEAQAFVGQIVPSLDVPEGPLTPPLPTKKSTQSVLIQTIPVAINPGDRAPDSAMALQSLSQQMRQAVVMDRYLRSSLVPSSSLAFASLEPGETLLPNPSLAQSISPLRTQQLDHIRLSTASLNLPTMLNDVSDDVLKTIDLKPTTRFVQTLIPSVHWEAASRPTEDPRGYAS